MKLTKDEIRDRIAQRDAFWVGSKAERAYVCTISSTLNIPYATQSDDRGGFYAFPRPNIKKPKAS
jgi:hypothetical protein